MSSDEERRPSINHRYYLMAIIGFVAVNALFFTVFDPLTWTERICLGAYVVAQALLVVACWNLVMLPLDVMWPNARWTSWLHGLFAPVLVLLAIDYLLFTIIELHLLRWVKDVWLARGFESLVRTIIWTNVPSGVLFGLTFLTLVVAPVAGMLAYRSTMSGRAGSSGWGVFARVLVVLAIGATILYAEEAASLHVMRAVVIKDKYRIFPIPTKLVKAPTEILSIPVRVKPLRDPARVAGGLDRLRVTSRSRPHVFLFAIETLRADVVDAEVAPNLYRFAQENMRVPLAYASGNYSVTAFHSLFTANHALYVDVERQRGDALGSVPLRIFRQLGYDIHLLASWDFSLNEHAFGRGRRLASTFVDSRTLTSRPFTPVDRHETIQEWRAQWEVLGESLTALDRRVVELFGKHPALTAEGPQFLITYVGSAHWPYYWPEDWRPRFEPYTDFFRGQFLYSLAERRRLMMNRYRNSVQFVDSLFGAMIRRLKDAGLYEDSIVVVLGDHGDEIYDHSRVGRGHLHNVEIAIPLAFKFERGGARDANRFNDKLGATVNVLPTVLDGLGVEGNYAALFDGESLFKTVGTIGVSSNEIAAAEKALVVYTRQHKAFFDIDRGDPTAARRLRLLQLTDDRDGLLAPLGSGMAYADFLNRSFAALFRGESSLPFVLGEGH